MNAHVHTCAQACAHVCAHTCTCTQAEKTAAEALQRCAELQTLNEALENQNLKKVPKVPDHNLNHTFKHTSNRKSNYMRNRMPDRTCNQMPDHACNYMSHHMSSHHAINFPCVEVCVYACPTAHF